jgi:hypothetical protein
VFAGALVAYAGVRAGRLELIPVAVGAIALILLVASLVIRLPSLVAWALGVLGATYAVALLLRGETIDALAPVYAVVLLLVGELAYWSLELHLPAAPDAAARRAGRLALLALVAGGIAALVLAVSEAAGEGGLGLEAAGVVAAGGTLALVALLARSARAKGARQTEPAP